MRVEPPQARCRPRRGGFRRALAACALLAATSAQAQAPTAPGDGFEVERYTLALRPDLASTAVSGREQLRIRVTASSLDQLRFSPNALQVTDATLDGQPLAATRRDDAIVFALPQPLPQGSVATLALRLQGTPARGVVRTGGGLYTSYFACDWMLCLQDSPGDKASFALDLFLPTGTTSQAVGRALPVQPLGDGLELHRWRSTRPMSAYLFGFAAGRFARSEQRDDAGRFVYLDASGAPQALAQASAQTPAIARFLAGKAGLPLPGHGYAQVLVPGDEAQEAATFALIGTDVLQRERDAPASDWVIAHELAHQWWGNLVTCARWQDFWLNEGITTFMVAAWKQQRFGAEAYDRELEIARGRLQHARAAGFDKPLAWSGRYPSLSLRRAVQYSKGALFMDLLRQQLGEQAFWRGLRDYTRRHAGATVTSADFQQAMQRASGRDLSALFAQWVYDLPARD